MQLAQRLVRRGVLLESDLARIAEVRAQTPGRPLHEILVERNFAKEEDVLAALAEEFGMELVDLTEMKIDPAVLTAMPLKLVHRRTIMPLKRDNGTLVVATGDPFDVYALDELAMLTGLQVHPVLASPREITRLIKAYFGVGGETVSSLIQERGEEQVELLEGLDADDSEAAKMASEASVVKLVNEILDRGRQRAGQRHPHRAGRGQPPHPLPHRRPAPTPADAAGDHAASSRRSSRASRSWPT